MAVKRKKPTFLSTGRKQIKIKLTMQLFSRGHHNKMHLILHLFVQQVFSKTVVKNFPGAIFFKVSIFFWTDFFSWLPKGFLGAFLIQMIPKCPESAPRSPQEVPRKIPGSHQEAPRKPQEAPMKLPQRSPRKSAKKTPKTKPPKYLNPASCRTPLPKWQRQTMWLSF